MEVSVLVEEKGASLICINRFPLQTDEFSSLKSFLLDRLEVGVRAYEYQAPYTYMHLQDDSLDLCVALADQYLAKKTIDLTSVQLLGIACLFIACKCEEMITPTEENLCKYLLDLSLIDLHQCAFTSSEKAASAVCLARKILHADDSNAWTSELQRVSGFSEAVLSTCEKWLTKLIIKQAANKQKQKEKEAILPTNYLDKHEGMTKTVREILVDWLLQVQDDSLDLCVALADQYLAKKTIDLTSVQLLGIACLFIACKCEEMITPTMQDLCYLTSNTYTTTQLREMEMDVLATLNFCLCFPSAKIFLVRYLNSSQQSRNEENLCKYLLDLSLIDLHQCAFTSSEKAASAVCLARKILHADDSNAWTSELQRVSGFSEAVLSTCEKWLTKLIIKQAANKQKGIICKYKKLLQATSSELQTWIQIHS
ncbi:G2/mitotic-specific cyclin-B2-like [Anneissia japonica]|uniref:G2/mitotic-specific cyclin-B2-like n=1 Tax=Anneissia japonica TaxID=1529436 RepID=UPI0014256C82|nr:G2/mitotic-specific cyclin-B2-like [Anneissia japonica]